MSRIMMSAPRAKKTEVTKTPVVVEITTSPLSRATAPRVVSVPMGTRVDRVFNNDGSITLYARGIKIHRTLATEGDDAAEDGYDAEEAAEKFLNKWFGRNKPHILGRTAHGHFWKSRKQPEVEAPAEPVVPAKLKRVRTKKVVAG